MPSLILQGILPLSGLSLQAITPDPDTSRSAHMFEISSESIETTKLSWGRHNTQSCEHDLCVLVPLSSRSNDGLQGLHLCQRYRVTTMDETHRGQEIQVHDAAHESIPLCPVLSGNNCLSVCLSAFNCMGGSSLPRLLLINWSYWYFSPSYPVMSTGKEKNWRSTYCTLLSGSGRARPYSTWASRGAYPWSISSTHRDRS